MTRGSVRAALCAAIAIGAAAAASAAQQEPPPQGPPSARLIFHGGQAGIGVGFTWGAAQLEFQGKTYPVRVDGFVLGGIGASAMEGVGEVYGLTSAEDLNGNFTAVATGAAFGSGRGTLAMRNDKGVRVVLDTTGTGFGVALGARGFTLTVGEAGGPPAEAGARLPETLGFGEAKLGPLFFRPTLNAQVFLDAMHNAGFDGEWSFGPVDEVDHYVEHSNEFGLNLRYPMGEAGTLLGRVSGVYSFTGSGPDGPVCNTTHTTDAYTLESAYLAWKSGNLFPGLGFNAIEISGGNQNYQIGDGLLFWDGGQDCGGRGANWLSARKAFRETGIVRVTYQDLTLEAVHLKYNDHPDTHTRLAGARAEYVTDKLYMKSLKLGLMYFDIYESDNPTRDGMEGIYFYSEAAPLPFLPDLTYKVNFVREDNDESSGLTTAYGWSAGLAYQLSQLSWTPQIGYRYASFSGGENRAFDSLFTGLPDWGYWFQGELLGEFVLSNSNLNSHQVRLKMKPSEKLTINVIYYKFLLDHREQGFSVEPKSVSRSLADEIDFIVDYAPTNWWSLTATFSIAHPSNGFKQAVGGSATWLNGYLYTNFNF